MTSTNTNELIENVKLLLKNYGNNTLGNSLKGIKTYTKGLLSNNAVYPAITIVPVEELLGPIGSGREYNVQRGIDLEVHVKERSQGASSSLLKEICSSITDIFYDKRFNYNFNETVFNYDVLRTTFDFLDDDGIYQVARIPLTLWSKEIAEEPVTVETLTETRIETIGEYLSLILKKDNSLKGVNFFYKYNFPPTKIYNNIGITINEVSQDNEKREAGRDNPYNQFDIIIWSKASPYQKTLQINLDTADLVKKILQKYYLLDGRAYNSRIERIMYGYNEDLVLYGSAIRFIANTYKTHPMY